MNDDMDMTKQEIIDLINNKIGEYAGDAYILDQQWKEANPYSFEFRKIMMEYNCVNSKRIVLEELIDIIEKRETTTNV